MFFGDSGECSEHWMIDVLGAHDTETAKQTERRVETDRQTEVDLVVNELIDLCRLDLFGDDAKFHGDGERRQQCLDR